MQFGALYKSETGGAELEGVGRWGQRLGPQSAVSVWELEEVTATFLPGAPAGTSLGRLLLALEYSFWTLGV